MDRMLKIRWKGYYIDTNGNKQSGEYTDVVSQSVFNRISNDKDSSIQFAKSKIFDFAEPEGNGGVFPWSEGYVDEEKPKKEKKHKESSSSSLPWYLRAIWWVIKLPFKILWWMFGKD